MKLNSNADCVHAWAHQHADQGKYGNIYFDGPVIYSYGSHFPMARLDGVRVFITMSRYSPTTSNHQRLVRGAVSHKRLIWVEYVPTGPTLDDHFFHKNINYWISLIKSLLEEIKAHPRRKSLTAEITRYVQYINSLLSEVQLKLPKKIQDILSSPTIETISAYRKQQLAIDHAKATKAQRQEEKRHKENIIKFEKGLISKLPYNPQDPGLTYLRYNEAKQRIETSKEVQVPIEIARRFWDFIQSILPCGCNNNCNYSILNFDVKEVSQERIVIGCHTIPMSQVDKISLQLGWKQPG